MRCESHDLESLDDVLKRRSRHELVELMEIVTGDL